MTAQNVVTCALVTTGSARKYLAQLCKHFGHKVPVQLNGEDHGIIEFPSGTCDLSSNQGEQCLTIRIAAKTEDDCTRLRGVIESHLARFAFREELAFRWNAAAA